MRACKAKVRVNISPGPLRLEIYKKNAPPQGQTVTLREPPQSKWMSTLRKSHFILYTEIYRQKTRAQSEHLDRAQEPFSVNSVFGENKTLLFLECFWRMMSAKYAPECSESSASHKKKHNSRSGTEPSRVPIVSSGLCCAKVGRFPAMLLLCGFATG